MKRKREEEEARMHGGHAIRSGMTGEFFRYQNVMGDTQPSTENQAKSLRLADDIRCDVCETILHHVIKKIRDHPTIGITEDYVHDALDGMLENEHEYQHVEDDGSQFAHVDWHKRGCNKHFKDEFVALGYHVVLCDAEKKPKKAGMACVKKGDLPNEHSMETYEVWKEAVFYACEHTIGTYTDEIRDAIVKHHMGGIQYACREEAYCGKKKSTFEGNAEL